MLGFIDGDPIIIHNASFDLGFLNNELSLIKKPPLNSSQVIDTLLLAREKFPGSPASLDALCRRFSIDNSNRQLHGALLDSYILAEVYLELIGGNQPNFELDERKKSKLKAQSYQLDTNISNFRRNKALPTRVTKREIEEHYNFIKAIKGLKNWSSYD